MRKIRFLSLLLLITSAVWAQNEPSSLQVRMWDNSLFSAVFGGDEGGRYQRTYNARSISGGEYYLKITQKDTRGETIVFEGQIDIPEASRVQAVVQADGSLEISTIEDKQRTNSSFDLKSKISSIEDKVRGKTNTREEERAQLIESLEFTDLKNRVTNARTEYIKDSIAVAGLRKNLFTTAYIVQLTKLFKAENDRLEFAQRAYVRVVDPEEYHRVRAILNEVSRPKLDAYMKENEGKTQRREFQGLF
ncbi:MAG: DUF4476 domain-containing protein [Prevotellaceae bacterium]|jgi:hypothetical protein|nr:DUF4476 domain-containing protein [Prevotellaceae bacterium]